MDRRKFELFFEEKDGVLTAQLSEEACDAILDTLYCIPCSTDGKPGLIYCGEDRLAEAEPALRMILMRLPRLSLLLHRLELDASGVLRIPRSAADFAKIRNRAILTRSSGDWLVLQTADEDME